MRLQSFALTALNVVICINAQELDGDAVLESVCEVTSDGSDVLHKASHNRETVGASMLQGSVQQQQLELCSGTSGASMFQGSIQQNKLSDDTRKKGDVKVHLALGTRKQMSSNGPKFNASLGAFPPYSTHKRVEARNYIFQIVEASTTDGKYGEIMVEDCKAVGMKPVCDRRYWCERDETAIYLGQDGYMSSGYHQNILRYFPSGWDDIKEKFKGLCFYPGSRLAKYWKGAYCNYPNHGNSMRLPAQTSKFMCAKIGEAPATTTTTTTNVEPFEASLGAFRNMEARTYRFRVVEASTTDGKYPEIMVKDCKAVGMKPVCNSKYDYRKGYDETCIFMGQTGYMSYGFAQKHPSSYFPSGWTSIRRAFKGLCFYDKGGSWKAPCNYPTNHYSWRSPAQTSKFMCARIDGALFEVPLGAKNGVEARTYRFQVVEASTTKGSYSDIMVNDCKAAGFNMKPVCEDESWCKDDDAAVYIGHSGHISDGTDNQTLSHFPSGWEAIRRDFKGLCFYTANHGSGSAYCNYPTNSHSWRTPAQTSKFMCAKVEGAPFEASLGAKNGVEARTYRFQYVEASTTDGKYSEIMVKDCKAVGMKPVCNQRYRCKDDESAIYIGQTYYMSHGSYQKQPNLNPSGWMEIRGEFKGLCFYPGSGVSYPVAPCNDPFYSSSWRLPSQKSKFMCARVVQ